MDETTQIGQQVDKAMVTLTAPSSSAAEQYRTLFYRLERMREMRPMKVVSFTSAMPGEGKTVTAVNLALSSARAHPDRRILLIDADLRCSQVAEYLGIRSRPGLAELLSGQADIQDVVRRFRQSPLAVIPGGAPPAEPTQLLASVQMKQLVKGLRDNFDEIYIDLPPALPFADSPILAAQSDGVIVVIRAYVTSSQRVTQTLEQLSGAPVIGCVLNGADMTSVPYLKGYAGR
ncbi:MAG TPA: CpsD/CapB family tyrosine-protein kinase [Myxococcaceae bacterium]|nr:CpsD/CapB family tyrosine-protein kinase [Myxococcaceae bacterium]